MKPDYYKAGNLDVIAFCQHHDLGFAEGNIIKYVTRAGKKTENPIEDLKKAKEYLERLIKSEEAKIKDAEKHLITNAKTEPPISDMFPEGTMEWWNEYFKRNQYWHNTPIESTNPFLSKKTIDAYAKQGLYFRWSDDTGTADNINTK